MLRVYPKTGRVTVEGVNMVKRHQRARRQTSESGIIEFAGADPSLEGDAARSEERRADAGAPAEGQGRHGGADRGEVGSADPEEPVTMAETTEKAPKAKAPKKGAPEGRAARQGQGQGRRRRPARPITRPRRAEGTPRLQDVLREDGPGQAAEGVRAHEPAPGAAAREDRAQRRHGRGEQEPEAARGRRRGAGADHRPAAGGDPGQEGDRELRPARRACRSAAPVTLRGARMYEFLDRFIRWRCRGSATSAGCPTKSFDGRGQLHVRHQGADDLPGDRLRQGREDPRDGHHVRDDRRPGRPGDGAAARAGHAVPRRDPRSRSG